MPSVRSSTSQRCAMAERTMRSRREAGCSVVMRGARFFEIGFDDVALLDDDFFAGFQAFEDLGVVDVAFAQLHRPCCVGFAGADEDYGGVLHVLQSFRWNHECSLAL